MERCSLTVPAEPALLSSLRLFAVVVARLWGAGEDDVDDLRLAVSELATAAITGATDQVTVVLQRSGGGGARLIVEPVEPAGLEQGPVPSGDVVGALFERVGVDGGRVVVELDWRT